MSSFEKVHSLCSSMCLRRSCPHAPSMSLPISRRIVTLTPPFSRRFWNAAIAAWLDCTKSRSLIGLTGMLEDEEILQILEGEGNVEERAQRLVQAANDHGGRDNIAVIIMEPFSDEVSG